MNFNLDQNVMSENTDQQPERPMAESTAATCEACGHPFIDGKRKSCAACDAIGPNEPCSTEYCPECGASMADGAHR